MKKKEILKKIIIVASIIVILFFSIVTLFYVFAKPGTGYSHVLVEFIIMPVMPTRALYELSLCYYDSSEENHWDGYKGLSLILLKLSAWVGWEGYPQAELSGYYYFKKKDLNSAIFWMEKAVANSDKYSEKDYKWKLEILYGEKSLEEDSK